LNKRKFKNVLALVMAVIASYGAVLKDISTGNAAESPGVSGKINAKFADKHKLFYLKLRCILWRCLLEIY
jgi:hypothetical protein